MGREDEQENIKHSDICDIIYVNYAGGLKDTYKVKLTI